jgi:hypothetical protein
MASTTVSSGGSTAILDGLAAWTPPTRSTGP